VKGVGPAWADLLRTELQITTLGALLEHYPFRYEDRSQVLKVENLTQEHEGTYVQLIGTLGFGEVLGSGKGQRLVADLMQGSATIELVWFQGITWFKPRLATMRQVLVYGKLQSFNGRYSITHPEIEPYSPQKMAQLGLVPVYPTSDKMKSRRLDSKALGKIIAEGLAIALPHLEEDLPKNIVDQKGLMSRAMAVQIIHWPLDAELLATARLRLKCAELVRVQLPMCLAKAENDRDVVGIPFVKGALIKEFIENVLPFSLTDAQRRVTKEIWDDTHSGHHMNRLLQGDVGSGKTAVAFISMLMAVESGYQACLMAPTEILAEQHFAGLSVWAHAMGLQLVKLTGSITAKNRRPLHAGLASGAIHMLVGTHALIEDTVVFKNLALVVIDEQHRFGVRQRARLRNKGADGLAPHVLIMTATPIPRTLALTKFADLQVSVIDQLPAGRKPIVTVHRYEKDREKIYSFIDSELEKGRQAYFVFPLIEESEKLPLKALEAEIEAIEHRFSAFKVGIVHGRQKWPQREPIMRGFLANEIQILVATTVIEVGINVPNASVMLIENSERFGLAQLHQLRGRVGRGADQSYCILLSKQNPSADGRKRLHAMVSHTDGFLLAELDLELRGSGDMGGTQQSGLMLFSLVDLAQDKALVSEMYEAVDKLVSLAGNSATSIYAQTWAQALFMVTKPLQNLQKVG